MSLGGVLGQLLVGAIREWRPFSEEAKARRRARRAARKARRRGEPPPDTVDPQFWDWSADGAEGKSMFVEIVKSLVRHFGSAISGVIVGTGVATAEESTIFVNVAIGLLIYGATQGWSIIRKIRNKPRAS